ncbi:MotE family protein [Catonella massiliensis]|jgi:hypothetical protein|uniref:MotE family protein n=1 Tax=Catonella massiliensis TaxID=2799636 RepID=UPI001F3FCF1C|nr:hypothetical protein [Catonella massiliensis]
MADIDEMDELDNLDEVEDSGQSKEKKKDKKKKSEEKEGIFSRILTIIIVLFIVAIWLAIFALLIKYDVGGFGSTVLRPMLKDIPGINQILPDIPDEQAAEENNYPYKNLPEAMDRISELEAELAAANGTKKGNANYLAQLEAEVARLKTFEENQLQFQKEKDKFDKEVVFNDKAPDPEEYKKYYESIDPDNAAEIYRQVVEQQDTEKKLIEQAEMYKNMKPEEAAAILNGMGGDLDLVANILLHMKTKDAGAILAKMDTNMAAKITKKISIMQSR